MVGAFSRFSELIREMASTGSLLRRRFNRIFATSLLGVDARTRWRIADAWGRSFEEWSYAR